jgi:Tfp pilus assembly protein PilV
MANVFARKSNLGFSLIEVVLALAVFGLSVGLIELIITSVRADATVLNRIKARSLVLDQIEVLRHQDFADITTVDTTELISDLWNSGEWEVATVGSTQAVSALGSGEQALLVPGDRWADVTLSGQVYVDSTTPAGYDVGILLRAQDSDHRYRLHFNSSGTFIEREQAGVVTILSTINSPLPTNTWQSFSFGISGSTLSAVVGGVSSSVVDSTPITPDGHLALWSSDGCCVSFDNLNVTSSKANASWDFEGSSNTVGSLPPDWGRLSLSSLPGGAAHVTIENASGTELKKATVTVTWSDRGETRNESLTTYITRYGLQVE